MIYVQQMKKKFSKSSLSASIPVSPQLVGVRDELWRDRDAGGQRTFLKSFSSFAVSCK